MLLTAAVIVAIRHNYTRYDELLTSGYSRIDARDAVRNFLDGVLDQWPEQDWPPCVM